MTASASTDVLTAEGLTVQYGRERLVPPAVDNIDLTLGAGETLGLVGESGCGKSSTGRALVMLPPPTGGRVTFAGNELTGMSRREFRPLRRRIQLLWQDPISSLNPRRKALDIVAEPLRVAKRKDAADRAMATLAQVGVDENMAQRRPHEMSGGQCQRVAIARAVAQEPEVLICDEPVSALDVSVQAQVLNLLETMKRDLSLSMIFVSHDLAVVKSISDRVAVMYLGRICELAPSVSLYSSPRHHYTSLLLRSIPDPVRPTRAGGATQLGARADPVGGCRFADRCPAATKTCRDVRPSLTEVSLGHFVACHNPLSPATG